MSGLEKAATAAAQHVAGGLDRASPLGIGRGKLDLYAFAGPDALGIGADVAARLSSRTTAFGSAWGGYATDNGNRPSWGALGGLRATW